MVLTLGILGILWRSVCVFMLILTLVELSWAQRHDGDTLRSLRNVFASVLFIFLFPYVAAVDSYTDLTPGVDIRPVLEQWVWIGYAVLATSLIRFWLSLHRWARGKDQEE